VVDVQIRQGSAEWLDKATGNESSQQKGGKAVFDSQLHCGKESELVEETELTGGMKKE